MTLPKPAIHFEEIRRSGVADGFLQLPKERRFAIMLDPSGVMAGLGEMVQEHPTTYTMIRCLLSYLRDGEQVVVVGPRMQEAFSNTSLEDIPLEMVQLPYPCFYLALPESNGLEIWGGSRTQWHPVRGCYVMKEPAANSIVLFIWGEANERSLGSGDDASFWFRIDLDNWRRGKDGNTDGLNLETEFNRICSDTYLSENDDIERATKLVGRSLRGTNLDRMVEDILSDPRSDSSDAGMSIGVTSTPLVAKMKESARRVLRIAINTILYMNSSNVDLSDPVTTDNQRRHLESQLKRLKNPRKTKGRKLQKQIDALPRHRIVWVGPTLEQTVGVERDFPSGDQTSAGQVSAHLRRGHWHTYRVGPRKIEGVAVPTVQRHAILKWIPPIWVTGQEKASSNTRRVYGVREVGTPHKNA